MELFRKHVKGRSHEELCWKHPAGKPFVVFKWINCNGTDQYNLLEQFTIALNPICLTGGMRPAKAIHVCQLHVVLLKKKYSTVKYFTYCFQKNDQRWKICWKCQSTVIVLSIEHSSQFLITGADVRILRAYWKKGGGGGTHLFSMVYSSYTLCNNYYLLKLFQRYSGRFWRRCRSRMQFLTWCSSLATSTWKKRRVEVKRMKRRADLSQGLLQSKRVWLKQEPGWCKYFF